MTTTDDTVLTVSTEAWFEQARAMLDFLEAHPEIEPRPLTVWSGYSYGTKAAEKFAAQVRALGDDHTPVAIADSMIETTREFGPHKILVRAFASSVCGEKRVVEKSVEEYVIPDLDVL